MSSQEEARIDLILDRLIRQARRESPDDQVRPSAVVIAAYVLHTASDSQREEVQRALAKSASFRQELLAIVRELDSLAITDTDAKATPSKVRDWFAPRIFIPVMTAAAAALLAIVAFWPSDEMELVATSIDKTVLISNRTRSMAQAASQPFQWPDSAALTELALTLQYVEGEFQLQPTAQVEGPPDTAFKVVLVMETEQGKRIWEVVDAVPRLGDLQSKEATAWLLSLPDRYLYKVVCRSDTTHIAWSAAKGRYGSVVVTFLSDGSYHSLPGHTFDFRTR